MPLFEICYEICICYGMKNDRYEIDVHQIPFDLEWCQKRKPVKDELTYHDKPKESGGGKKMLGFEPVTLVPFEPKLIDYKLLNKEHVAWLNNYNYMIRERVGAELKKQGKSQR